MKKIFISTLFLFSVFALSQVAIGKTSVSTLSDNTTPNPGISLEFGSGPKGIVLPWVNGTTNATPFITGHTGSVAVVNGTIVYDTADHKVKYLKNGTWFDLSRDANGTANTALQDGKTDSPTAKAAIGAAGQTDTTPGILVLTDTDKAMILPKTAVPHLNIKNPAAGMMVYDTTNRQLAVYNGTNWSFWKP